MLTDNILESIHAASELFFKIMCALIVVSFVLMFAGAYGLETIK